MSGGTLANIKLFAGQSTPKRPLNFFVPSQPDGLVGHGLTSARSLMCRRELAPCAGQPGRQAVSLSLLLLWCRVHAVKGVSSSSTRKLTSARPVVFSPPRVALLCRISPTSPYRLGQYLVSVVRVPLVLSVRRLGIPLAAVSISKNAAGESKVTMLESVREFDVYIINTGCGEINSA